MPEHEYPNVDVHLTRLFTRDVLDAGGQIIRRMNNYSNKHIDSRMIELRLSLENLREAAARL